MADLFDDPSGAEPEAEPAVVHYYVDEAGDHTLFNAQGEVLIGSAGCTNFFLLGKLSVSDPQSLDKELDSLRVALLADPYFKRVPSMDSAQRKTALAFHAKDDIPEVRREVYKVLLRHDVRFYAVVRNKRELLKEVQRRNQTDPTYRYHGNELYDALVSKLFTRFRGDFDVLDICFSKRGAKNRSHALKAALSIAARDFTVKLGIQFGCPNITSCTPAENGGLQAVDYYLWALQRFFEKREERYVELIWPQVGEVHDLDGIEDGCLGIFFGRDKQLSLAVRDPLK